jgi:hypothetical protein
MSQQTRRDLTPGERSILAYKDATVPDPFWICRQCGDSTILTWYVCERCERSLLERTVEMKKTVPSG